MEYCCHVWAGASSCFLELLDKLQKWTCRTVGPSLVTSIESLAYCQNVASSSLFYRYYFGGCSSELVQLVPLRFRVPGSFTLECREVLTTLGFIPKIPFTSHLSTEFIKVPS